MPESTKPLAGGFTAVDDDLEREFETRVAESSVLAFRVAYSVLRNREEAEDVAQNAFIKAYGHFHGLRGRDRFKAWLVRIAWRLAINRARDNRRRAIREDVRPDVQSAPTGEDIAVANERAAHLWAAIDELPEKLRAVVVLASIEDNDVAAVARLLALPEGTVKSRLFLARRQLAGKLQWIATATR